MSMPDHIILSNSRVTGFTRMLLENGKTELFCFTRVGEPAHISKISYPFGVMAAWPRGEG